MKNKSQNRRATLIGTLMLFFTLIGALGIPLSVKGAKPAWAGRPEYAFGDLGKTTGLFTRSDYFSALAAQPDGKLVAANVAYVAGYDFGVVRYDADGKVDRTFGNQGSVTTDFAGGDDQPYAIAVQSDGKIIVAGSAVADAFRPGLIRYNANGTLDTTFGTSGKVVLRTVDGQAFALRIQPDGKILLAGFISVFQSPTRADFFTARLLPNGTPDNSFGTGGIVKIDFSLKNDVVNDLVIQPDGKIVVAGVSGIDTEEGDFAVARLNSDGKLDASFGEGGRVKTDFYSGNDEAAAVALAPDGKIVVGGRSYTNSGPASAITRYKTDGALDSEFAAQGRLTTYLPFAGFRDLVVQSNGKIIAGGRYRNDFALTRYDRNGNLDTTFDFDGLAQTSFLDQPSLLNAVLLTPDGRLLAAGSTRDPSDGSSIGALASYQLTIANADFDGDNRTDFSVFRPANGTWYIARSRLGFNGVSFGLPDDKPLAADFDDDGKTDITIFRSGYWYFLASVDNTFRTVQFGQPGDVPISADFDGDAKTDFAVFRSGIWYYQVERYNQSFGFQFGQAGDIPVAADYDHDGKDDFAVFRQGVWYIQQSTAGLVAVPFGQADDVPVPADYDGDGRADVAVYRRGIWYLNRSRSGFLGVSFGAPNDVPVQGDFDGDDAADLAVYRNGFWYSLNIGGDVSAAQFGTETDRPIPIF